MIKHLFLTVLFSFILTGCAFGPKYDKMEFTETKTVVQRVPEDLTVPCKPTAKRIVKEEYLKLQPNEREAALKDYSISLLGSLKECDSRMEKIRNLPITAETK